jgi:nucleotide-binding universal stress UspA family protein
MNKILVAVDFSEYTDIACEYALEIAKLNKAEICLIHVYFDRIQSSASVIPDAYGINHFVNAELISDSEKNAEYQLLYIKSDMISKLEKYNLSGIEVNTVVSSGSFESSFFDFCENYHPSIVIIGTKGKDKNPGIFGKAAHKIIEELRFPVLAIPVVASYSGIKNIMYATDLNDYDDVLIRKTYNLLDNFNIHIFCVHIVEKNEYLKAISIMDNLKLTYNKEKQEDRFNCDVFENINKHDEIENFIKENNIHLIVFHPQKTNFFKRLFGQNFSKKYLFETNIPLLAIR